MAIYTKDSTWKSIKKIFAKDTTWKPIKKVFVNINGVWRSIWPTIGPYTTVSPVIRLHTYRSTSTAGSQPPTDVGSVIRMGPGGTRGQAVTIADGESGTTYLWGYDGEWNENTSAVITRNFYYNSSNDFLGANAVPGVTDQLPNTETGIGLRDSKYIWYYVEETNSLGTGSDLSQPVFIIKQKPLSPTSFAITTPSIANIGAAITLSYSLDSTWYRNADLSKSYVEWFAESTLTSSPTSFIPGTKIFLNASSTSFTPTVAQDGKYIYAKITLINSYSTYYSDYSVTAMDNTTVKVQAFTPPVVSTYPSLSGSGIAGASITPTKGSYTNFKPYSTSPYVINFESAIIGFYNTGVTQGETSLPGIYYQATNFSGVTNFPYTVTQTDATNPRYIFYEVDRVLGTDGTTYYYYYSNPIYAKIGSFTDTFTRTVASGTSLGQINSSLYYTGPNASSGWSVNGSQAINTSAVSSSTSPSSWPKQVIETSGQPDVTVKVQLPTADAGLGVAFWVSGAGSWWAATSYKKSVVTVGITCTGTTYTGTTCPTLGVNIGEYCDCITVTIPEIAPACTISKTSMLTDGGSIGTTAGARCTDASPTTIYSCNTPVTGSTSNPTVITGPYSSSNVGSRCSTGTANTTYACDTAVYGASSVGTLTSAPYISSDLGVRCSAYTTNTSYSCNQAVSGRTYTGTLIASGNYAGNVGGRCSVSTASTSYACDTAVTGRSSVGSLTSTPYIASDVGVRCSSYTTNTSSTWQCGGSVTNASSVGSLVTTFSPVTLGQRCSGYVTNTSYACNVYQTGRTTVGTLNTPSASTLGLRCSAFTGSAGNYSYYTVGTVTSYNYSVVNQTDTTTYSYSVVSGTTTYSYDTITSSTNYDYTKVGSTTTRDYNTVGPSTTYSYYVNDNGTPSSTGKSWKTQVSGNTTLYKTYLRVYSANGSSVNLESENEVASSNSSYAGVYGVGVSTQGNNIAASLYSDSGLSAVLGSSTYLSPSYPTKISAGGSTSAGIIKGYTVDGAGTVFDNLTVIPSQ